MPKSRHHDVVDVTELCFLPANRTRGTLNLLVSVANGFNFGDSELFPPPRGTRRQQVCETGPTHIMNEPIPHTETDTESIIQAHRFTAK